MSETKNEIKSNDVQEKPIEKTEKEVVKDNKSENKEIERPQGGCCGSCS